jgi:hypothetical protein
MKLVIKFLYVNFYGSPKPVYFSLLLACLFAAQNDSNKALQDLTKSTQYRASLLIPAATTIQQWKYDFLFIFAFMNVPSSGVNFTNILPATFSNERFWHSFFV